MSKKINLTGKKFGKLLVLCPAPNRGKYNSTCWKCRCDCGNEKVILTGSLTSNNTSSCGCINIERMKKRATHGMSETKFYGIWLGIKNRCNNPNEPAYKDYGGRGIKVCDKWLESFENFRNDMYQEYLNHLKKYGRKNTSINRIKNNENYCPENCEWSTKKEQSENRRSNVLITYKGETMTISQWAKELNINRRNIAFRLKMKWSIDKIFSNKNYNSCRVSYKGKTLSIVELSKITNIPYNTIHARIKYLNMSVEEAISKPLSNKKCILFKGENLTIAEWSKKLNISCNTLYYRIKKGWTTEKIITTSLKTYKRKTSKH